MPSNELPFGKRIYRKINSYWASLTKEAVAWHAIALCIALPLLIFAFNIVVSIIGSILYSNAPVTGFCFLTLGVGIIGAISMIFIYGKF